jgi:quercetin dioxygenase-like cupin family protein
VIRGQGTCVCGDSRQALEPGMAFVIPANVVHAFETTHGQELDVIAFHPDSDFGPSADDHPMINRTMVNGISASKIQSIQTLRF